MTRQRRTKAAITDIRDAIIDFAQTEGPVTVRQTFYRLVTLGLVNKSESEYGDTVSRLMTQMREDDELDWDLVVDQTRYKREPAMFNSKAEAVAAAAQFYRRQAWNTQPRAIEVWCEKEALAGILMDVTFPLAVPLFIGKGYSSATYIHDCAMRIDSRAQDYGQATTILYFGDWDPWGKDMSDDLTRRLERYTELAFTTGAPTFEVIRIGLNQPDIATYGLPTRPTKTGNIKGFKGDSVELDALPPTTLRQLVRDAIESRMDIEAYNLVKVAEDSERGDLLALAKEMQEAESETNDRQD
jgi:hypothetical protein